ncbi:hypothetical protein R6Q59_005892 [Mikania micrantha]|uniref:C2H2-type domain-containing protein n=1 Tax=Mikania micrantha TaxID=192012 RepID=A0A5N6PVC0_9ASTR|nr:hypothetical protein E3N88_04762 [Mikania micrantha]
MEKHNCERSYKILEDERLIIGHARSSADHINVMESASRRKCSCHDGSSGSTAKDNLGDLAANGFPWPPRSYTCTFCKREFRSAQALGGHMNVHRRDRARLRQMASTDHSFRSNYNTLMINKLNLHRSNASFSTISSHPSTHSLSCVKGCEIGAKSAKNLEIVRWGLEGGLVGGESKSDDLDLELRLGFS